MEDIGGKTVNKIERMSALDGIRIRVEASTGLHDRPLHYQGTNLDNER